MISNSRLRPIMGLSALANRALMIKLLAAFTTYGFTILLARTMLPQDFGMVAFFLNLSLILSVVGAGGQQIAALRFIPPLLGHADHAALGAFIRTAGKRAAIGTLTLFLVALATAIAASVYGHLPNHTPAQLALGLALIPLVGWVDLQSHIARGYNHLILSLAPKEIVWRAATALIVVTLIISRPTATLTATFVLLALALTLIAISISLALILWRSVIHQVAFAPPESGNAKEWRSTSPAFWLTSVSNIFLANADVIVVGLVAGSKAAGVYFAANRLAMLLAFFLTSTNTVLAPLLSAAYHSRTRAEIAELVHQATVKMTIPTAALGAVMALFAPQFLLLFGPEFSQAAPALRILILAGLFNAATGPADIALNMCGLQKSAMLASAASLGISLALLMLGAATGDVNAIALAVLAATIVRKMMFWQLSRHHLCIRTDIFAALPRRSASVVAPQ